MWTLPSSFIWSFSRDSLHHQSWWRSTAVFAPWSMRIVFLFCICIYVLVDDGQLHYLVLFYLHPVQVCKSKNCKSHHVQLELQKPAASRPYISSSSFCPSFTSLLHWGVLTFSFGSKHHLEKCSASHCYCHAVHSLVLRDNMIISWELCLFNAASFWPLTPSLPKSHDTQQGHNRDTKGTQKGHKRDW